MKQILQQRRDADEAVKSPFSRAESYLIISIVYIFAFLVALLTYRYMLGAIWLRLLIADVAATIFTFMCSMLFRNASVYDPYWSVQPPVILFCLIGQTFTLAEGVLVVAVTMWALRLTANWAYTFHGLSHQDWRYTMLKKQTGVFYPLINCIGIHMVPTLVVYACTLPAVFVMQADAPFHPLSLVGWLLCLGAVTLQTVADWQMQAYRKNRVTPFIRCGLWKHARHPNYLGEILMWWGVALYAVVTLGFAWHLLLGAVLNTCLFFFVSIPLAERRQAKKEGFAEYRAQTRCLLPIPKRYRKSA